MAQNHAKFESFLWKIQLSELESIFRLIDGFLNDPKSIECYLEKNYENEPFGQIGVLVDSIMNFPNGVQIFRRQMIIVLITYLEQIIKDFFENFFIAKPDKMASFILNSNLLDEKFTKEMGDILVIGSEKGILKEFPKVAAKKASEGKNMEKTLERIEQLSGSKKETVFKRPLKNLLIDLDKKRNSLVHEALQDEISPKFLANNISAIRDFVNIIEIICSQNDIRVISESDYTG
jgi:hypothetical protein